ncbi:MAG TPA: hypothetical protein VHH53_12760, partial [Pseudonocardiaceae bacterium]|nr:hypothetical protein [Pseudonocardiaceae bacterium]
MLVIDRTGVVCGHSDSARSVLPGVATGSEMNEIAPPWLSHAHEQLVRSASTDVEAAPVVAGAWNGRELEARPTTLPG